MHDWRRTDFWCGVCTFSLCDFLFLFFWAHQTSDTAYESDGVRSKEKVFGRGGGGGGQTCSWCSFSFRFSRCVLLGVKFPGSSFSTRTLFTDVAMSFLFLNG